MNKNNNGMFKKLKLFKVLYIDNDFYGARTTKKSLKYTFKDDTVVDNIIDNLFFEVPPIYSLGETDRQKYYLLKPEMEAISILYTCGCLIKSKPLHIFKWLHYCIKEFIAIDHNQEYYKDPNKEKLTV